ncbi:MAG: biotin/lipoyl-containing protein [Armatimonadota bacterium]|nr:biotin/lipoyl-binding protein [bacterium]
MDMDNIEALIKVLEGSRAEEISVKKGDFGVHIVKGRKAKSAGVRRQPTAAAAAAAVAAAEAAVRDTFILAPMVGIFHSVDGIAKIGSDVKSGQVVGAIESMKLLNDVVARVSGKIAEVMVEDGTPVEYGQPLCRLDVA